MSGRFAGFVPQDWRARLVVAHPRLFSDARLVRTAQGPAVVCAGWPAVPDGWRHLVETACARLEAAIADAPGAELYISDVSEKWGQLRLSLSAIGLGPAPQEAVWLAVELATARSAHVCEVCGGPGRWSTCGDWLATRCAAHAQGYAPVRAPLPDLEVVTRYVDGRPVRTARRYDPVTDRFVPAAVPADQE